MPTKSSDPAIAGPTIRMMLIADVLRATALSSDSLGTSLGRMDWRAGWLNDIDVPAMNVVANTIQTSIRPEITSAAVKNCTDIVTACVVSRMRFLLNRSATTPAKRPKMSIGIIRAATTSPTIRAESVSWRISTGRAICSIQSEAACPTWPSQR